MNLVCLSGRLVRDPELRQTKTDKAVATFSLAVSEGYGEKKVTNYLNCVAWNGAAEFIGRNFHQGDPMECAGRLTSRSYEKNGSKVYVTEVVIDHANFTLSRKTPSKIAEEEPGTAFEDVDGELPF